MVTKELKRVACVCVQALDYFCSYFTVLCSSTSAAVYHATFFLNTCQIHQVFSCTELQVFAKLSKPNIRQIGYLLTDLFVLIQIHVQMLILQKPFVKELFFKEHCNPST
jgi:hypothetical protein